LLLPIQAHEKLHSMDNTALLQTVYLVQKTRIFFNILPFSFNDSMDTFNCTQIGCFLGTNGQKKWDRSICVKQWICCSSKVSSIFMSPWIVPFAMQHKHLWPEGHKRKRTWLGFLNATWDLRNWFDVSIWTHSALKKVIP